jgi:hypothetical protein
LPSSFGGTLSSPRYSLRAHVCQAGYSTAAVARPMVLPPEPCSFWGVGWACAHPAPDRAGAGAKAPAEPG